MNRRMFAQAMGGAAAAAGLAGAQPAGGRTAIYRLDYFYFRQGSQGARISEFLSSQMPLIVKNTRAAGVFTTVLGPHVPMTLLLEGFGSLEDMEAADRRLHGDAGYRAAFEKIEQGAEPPFDYCDRVLLRATDFSPEIAALAEKPKAPRIFELRVYHSPTERQLGYLHQRFAGPEISVFHHSGIFPILYTDTLVGPNMPNLTYLIPFASLADREKAWAAFFANPDWVKARDESVAHGGQIVASTAQVILQPAPFSPIQ